MTREMGEDDKRELRDLSDRLQVQGHSDLHRFRVLRDRFPGWSPDSLQRVLSHREEPEDSLSAEKLDAGEDL